MKPARDQGRGRHHTKRMITSYYRPRKKSRVLSADGQAVRAPGTWPRPRGGGLASSRARSIVGKWPCCRARGSWCRPAFGGDDVPTVVKRGESWASAAPPVTLNLVSGAGVPDERDRDSSPRWGDISRSGMSRKSMPELAKSNRFGVQAVSRGATSNGGLLKVRPRTSWASS